MHELEKDYYERYWQHMETVNKKGVATAPPEWNEVNLNRILKVSKPIIKGIVLDVGCGSGFFTNELAKLNGVNVYGVDISETAIKLARDLYNGIDFKVSPVTDLPFPSLYFDVITSIEVVEHILDVEKMFREFNRTLKMGGHLIITTTDFNLLKILILAFIFDRYFYPTNPHIRFFTKKTLKNVLENSGFEMINHKWNGSYFGLMPKGQIVIAKKVKDYD